MVWPKKLGSTGDCSCPPFEGTQMQFTDCAENCNTEYSISIVNNTLACFASLTPEQNHTPVYFIAVRAVPCLVANGTTKHCYIRKIARSYSVLIPDLSGIYTYVQSQGHFHPQECTPFGTIHTYRFTNNLRIEQRQIYAFCTAINIMHTFSCLKFNFF